MLQASLASKPSPTSREPISISEHRQVFIDNHLVDEMQNLRRVLNPAEKYPLNPILKAEMPWEYFAIQAGQGPPLFDDQEQMFKMWYETFRMSQRGSEYTLCYATSKDGIRWTRPTIGLIEYEGSKDNNIVLFGNRYIAGPNIIKDLRDPDPSRRYKAVYYDEGSENKERGFCVAFSPDGIHWAPHPKNPHLSAAGGIVGDTHTLLGWDPRHRNYVAYPRPGRTIVRGKGPGPVEGAGRRTIGRSESDDFVNWSLPEIVLRPDEQDSKDMELYSMSVSAYQGTYVGLLWIYHNDPPWPWPKDKTITDDQLTGLQQRMDVQLAFSRDGHRWERAGDRRTFLGVGIKGSWDEAQIYPTAPVVVGNEIWIYYTGMNVRHTFESLETLGQTFDGQKRLVAIGLGKLRLDGFVSIDSGATEGMLLTKPLVFDGERLIIINADSQFASKAGYVRVELQDREGRVIPGYEASACDPFSGNSIHHTVSWQGKTSLPELIRQPVRLKFLLKRTKLYSLQFR